MKHPDNTSVHVPIEMHLINEGLIARDLQQLITEVQPDLPAFRDLVRNRAFTVQTPLTTWHVGYRSDGRVGSFCVADDRHIVLAEFVAVGWGDAEGVWQACLQRCRDLHRVGKSPLSRLEETPPGTAAWAGLILRHAHSQLSADQKSEMERLVLCVTQAFIERTLGYGLPILEHN